MANMRAPRRTVSIKMLLEKWMDKLHGGLADKKTPDQFDKRQLEAGIRVEMEHTDDSDLAKEIAMDHLSEDPDYYVKLKKVEKKGEKKKIKKEVKVDDADPKIKKGVRIRLIKDVPGFSKGDTGEIVDDDFRGREVQLARMDGQGKNDEPFWIYKNEFEVIDGEDDDIPDFYSMKESVFHDLVRLFSEGSEEEALADYEGDMHPLVKQKRDELRKVIKWIVDGPTGNDGLKTKGTPQMQRIAKELETLPDLPTDRLKPTWDRLTGDLFKASKEQAKAKTGHVNNPAVRAVLDAIPGVAKAVQQITQSSYSDRGMWQKSPKGYVDKDGDFHRLGTRVYATGAEKPPNKAALAAKEKEDQAVQKKSALQQKIAPTIRKKEDKSPKMSEMFVMEASEKKFKIGDRVKHVGDTQNELTPEEKVGKIVDVPKSGSPYTQSGEYIVNTDSEEYVMWYPDEMELESQSVGNDDDIPDFYSRKR